MEENGWIGIYSSGILNVLDLLPMCSCQRIRGYAQFFSLTIRPCNEIHTFQVAYISFQNRESLEKALALKEMNMEHCRVRLMRAEPRPGGGGEMSDQVSM